MALPKHLLTRFAFFSFLTKQAFCAHRLFTLAQTDDKQPGGGKGEHAKALVKMHAKLRVAVKATKHVHERYTHANAKASILWAQKQHRPQHPHEDSHMTNKDHMSYGGTRTTALGRA